MTLKGTRVVLITARSVSLYIGKECLATWNYNGQLSQELIEEIRTAELAPVPGNPDAA